jgi:hypothetical protein
MFASKGGRVGRIKPNENGIYCGLPLMTLGETTQNRTYYDPQSLIQQITDPQTRFNKVLSQGKLYGEFGHPSFNGLSQDDAIQRLVTVDEKNHSHMFTSIYTDTPGADGTVVLRGDLKPTGPYGPAFKESLDDPVVNTAFSLRAYVSTNVRPDGLKFRTVRQLCTWDTVGASGYAGTDKAHAIGLESFSGDQYDQHEIQIMTDGNLMIDQIALETFMDTELNEILGVSSVSQIIQSRTFVKVDKSLQERFPGMYAQSVFNEYFKEG